MAREALSARIDGEREPVPGARVNEHLDECAHCRAWFEQAKVLAEHLRTLAQPTMAVTADPAGQFSRVGVLQRCWQRWALMFVGVTQIVLGMAQALGLSLGLSGHHGMEAGGHLFNESTAWTVTLGVVMVGAALRPGAAAGLAGVLTVFGVVLTVYVIADAFSGAVTLVRVLSHLPVVVGAVLAVLVWRRSADPEPTPAAESEIVLPRNASRGRQRGHLWPTDGSAA